MPWEAPKYWTHPEGEFPAQLTNWEESVGKFGPQVRWTFETDVEREDGKPPQLSRTTSMTLSAKSVAGEIIQALGFAVPAPDEAPNFDADALIGSQCVIVVEHDHQADGSVWANIKAFKPVRKQATVASGFQAGANAKDRAPKATAEPAAPTGDCPDPAYDHGLKPGKPGFDPFHDCSLVKKAA